MHVNKQIWRIYIQSDISVIKSLYTCIKRYAYKYQPYIHNQMDYDKGLFHLPPEFAVANPTPSKALMKQMGKQSYSPK